MVDGGVFKDYFNASISNDVQQDIVRHVFNGYVEADKLVKRQEYQPGPARNLFPYVRWATIDNNCLALNNKYPGLETISELNLQRNSFFTLIRLGNVRMTISAVSSSSALPREALFRNDLASCQYRFDISEDQTKLEFRDLKSLGDGIVYAFVIHGPVADNPRLPAFIHIGFPDQRCTQYLDRIDLLRKYPDLIEQLMHEDMERIKDTAQVTLNVVHERLL
jgi:hypothetical protein